MSWMESDIGLGSGYLELAEPFRPSSLMVLLFLKVTGIDSSMGLRFGQPLCLTIYCKLCDDSSNFHREN